MEQQDGMEVLVYVGTYTRKSSEGIYVYRLDQDSGALQLVNTAKGLDNPSFLTLGPQGHYLYAVNELRQSAGRSGGGVSAFSVDPQTGELTFLNQQPSGGDGPCHVSVDKTRRLAFVANYAGGTACVLPIEADGRLGPATDVIDYEGGTDNPERLHAHTHSVTIDPTNRYAIIANLGLDKVMSYRIDFDHGKLIPNGDPCWVPLKKGAGPRHFRFHPSGDYGYVINELDSTLTAFAYDKTKGTLSEVQTLSTLPEDFKGESYCAAVHISSSGKYLYGSNRGHDSIAIFAVDESAGRLTCIGYEPTQGKYPRSFAIDPTGNFLLVAHQNSDTIVSFRVDQQTGKLMPAGQVVNVSIPVCVRMRTFPV